MSEIPFLDELLNYHKVRMKAMWKKAGIVFDDFDDTYNKYIRATHCEICKVEFLSTRHRVLEHSHETGEIRGIVCTKCNHHKKDRKISSLNTSGYKGISCIKHKNPKNGIQYRFNAYIDGKEKTIKSSVNLEWLIEFAENWKKENNYYT